MKKLLFVALILSALAGCSEPESLTPSQIATLEKNRNTLNEQNQKSIDEAVFVGKTPFGEDIYAADIKYACSSCNPLYDVDHHTVYFVGNVITKNYEVKRGKSTIHKIEVTLKENPSPEDVIKEAERLKKEISLKNTLEFKEYTRLKEKFENHN